MYVDIVASEGDLGILANLQRKAEQADEMFANLIAEMNDALAISKPSRTNSDIQIPSWLGTTT